MELEDLENELITIHQKMENEKYNIKDEQDRKSYKVCMNVIETVENLIIRNKEFAQYFLTEYNINSIAKGEEKPFDLFKSGQDKYALIRYKKYTNANVKKNDIVTIEIKKKNFQDTSNYTEKSFKVLSVRQNDILLEYPGRNFPLLIKSQNIKEIKK